VTPHRFEDGQPMLLAGLRRRHAFVEAERGIAEQWREFLAGQPIDGRHGSAFYGVMCGADDRSVEYMCGVEVGSFGAVRAEVGRVRVPAQRYAVFQHPQGATLASTWRGILAWLADGPYESAHRPDFERYPDAPDGSSLGGVEIWVGVVEKGTKRPASA
jgi:AraC family transcriptional regulator